MDTRFWGPSGWRLLHMIATSGKTNRDFWESLPYVLPCKFCRTSLTTYYEQHPIPRENMSEWLYKIHNLVNQKLRDQGQHLEPNPPFDSVQSYYSELLSQGCSKTEFPGWDFLFSIADNHPDSFVSKPTPDAPETMPKTLADRNRYNMITVEERKKQLKRFWASIPKVLPFSEWQTSWAKYAGPIKNSVSTRKSSLKWLWTIRCGLESDLQQLSHKSFYGLCKEIANHRSGCSKSLRAKTCRRLGGKRKTRKHR